jgi:signal transduction histidine kinase
MPLELPSLPPRARYLVAVAATGLAYLAQAAIWHSIPPSPYLLFYPATLLVAWSCGVGPALITMALSCVVIATRFLEPSSSIGGRDVLDLSLFAAVSTVMCVAVGRLRAALAEARAARQETEAMARTKEEILHIVSHDLRSPLTAIALSAESIRRHGTDPRLVQVESDRIKRLSHAAAALVGDVVDLGRAEAGLLDLELNAVSAAQLVADAVDASAHQARASGVEIEVRADRELVLCDARRVRQIVGNLLGNALRFVPRGGTVTITASASGTSERFEVRDTGPGMSPESRDRVFERHFSGDRRGLGLGLHIAKTLVHAHHGEIGVESELGVGTAFWFTLPLAQNDARSQSTPSGSKADFRPHRVPAR